MHFTLCDLFAADISAQILFFGQTCVIAHFALPFPSQCVWAGAV